MTGWAVLPFAEPENTVEIGLGAGDTRRFMFP